MLRFTKAGLFTACLVGSLSSHRDSLGEVDLANVLVNASSHDAEHESAVEDGVSNVVYAGVAAPELQAKLSPPPTSRPVNRRNRPNRATPYPGDRIDWALMCREDPCTQPQLDSMDKSKVKVVKVIGRSYEDVGLACIVLMSDGWPHADSETDSPLIVRRKVALLRLNLLDGMVIRGKQIARGHHQMLDVHSAFTLPPREDEFDMLEYAAGAVNYVGESVNFLASAAWSLAGGTLSEPEPKEAPQEDPECDKTDIPCLFVEQAHEDVAAIVKLELTENRNRRKDMEERQQKEAKKRREAYNDLARNHVLELVKISKPLRALVDESKEKPVCEVHRDIRPTTASRALKDHSDKNKALHQAELAAVAQNIVLVLFAGLRAAADAGLPGIGTVFRKGSQLTMQVHEQLVQSGSMAAGGAGGPLKRLADQFLQSSDALDSADEGVRTNLGQLDEVTRAAKDGSKDAAMESYKTQFADQGQVIRFLEKAKRISLEVLSGGASEAAWAAAELIPLIGPFIGMGKEMLILAAVGQAARQSMKDYYKTKDVILRSLFRVRDCALFALLESQASWAIDTTIKDKGKSQSVRILALYEILESTKKAYQLNHELTGNMYQKKHHVQSKESHELAVMKRLTTGKAGYGITVPKDERGYLDKKHMLPSAWAKMYGPAILEAYQAKMTAHAQFGLKTGWYERRDQEVHMKPL